MCSESLRAKQQRSKGLECKELRMKMCSCKEAGREGQSSLHDETPGLERTGTLRVEVQLSGIVNSGGIYTD